MICQCVSRHAGITDTLSLLRSSSLIDLHEGTDSDKMMLDCEASSFTGVRVACAKFLGRHVAQHAFESPTPPVIPWT